jgi:hypothetical protein
MLFFRVWWSKLSETWPLSGDEAIRVSDGRLERPTVQPCGTEHALAAKGRVSIRKLTSAILCDFNMLTLLPKLEIEYYVSLHLRNFGLH